MRKTFPPVQLVAVVAALAACDSSALVGPMSRPPAMVVNPVVDASSPRMPMRVVNLTHRSLEYGACFNRFIDRKTATGWEATNIATFRGACVAIGYGIRGFGSEADVFVPLTRTPEPGEYRVRMRFSVGDGEVEGVSNTFRFE